MSKLRSPGSFMLGKRIFPMNIKPHMTVDELIDEFGETRAYNAGRLYEACRLYEKMLDEDATIAVTLAGAMAPAGMGGPIITLMEKGFVDFIVSTGANLYHDLHFALDLPVYQGDFRANDVELRKRGIVRIYDIFVPDDALLKTDDFLKEIFLSQKLNKPISTAELHRIIGGAILTKGKNPERSIVAQAVKCDVPIYTSSLGDSSIGMNLSAAKMKGGTVTVDPDLDVMETTAIVYGSRKNGAIEIGGGSPKNFYLQTQPQLSQILKVGGGGQDFLIQITTSSPQWGGLSGATFQEAISWGKVNPQEPSNNVVVYADATIAVPILFAYIISRRENKQLKRLYMKRPSLLRKLQEAYDSKL